MEDWLSTGVTPTLLVHMQAGKLMRTLPPQAQHRQHDLDLWVPSGILAGHPTAMEASPQSARFVGSRRSKEHQASVGVGGVRPSTPEVSDTAGCPEGPHLLG